MRAAAKRSLGKWGDETRLIANDSPPDIIWFSRIPAIPWPFDVFPIRRFGFQHHGFAFIPFHCLEARQRPPGAVPVHAALLL
jgi:hypothetical protein